VDYKTVLSFWFEEIKPSQWWVKDVNFDERIRHQFLTIHEQADKCELFEWRSSIKGRLAEIIVLDQFSRNMFRDTPKAFSSDPLALALSQETISTDGLHELNEVERSFLYMPFMHSESLKIHELAVELFQSNGAQSNLDSELRHKSIIERFGRYPHRNEILGRESTAQEVEFLTQAGSSF